MGKTIVNKYTYNEGEVGKQFTSDNFEGEIVIVHGEKPTLYVKDEFGVKKIANGDDGVDQEAIDNLKIEITDNYTRADERLKGELLGEISDNRTQMMFEIDEMITQQESAYKSADEEIKQTIGGLSEGILSHTVNNIPISENPEISAEMILVGNYLETPLPKDTTENVITSDNLQFAVKKVENMIFANALAVAASLNDINSKLETLEESLQKIMNRLNVLEGNNE
jgi:hypothetical protein